MSNRPPTRALVAFATLALLCACSDNVGRAFHRPGPIRPPEPGSSTIQVVPTGGEVVDVRPRVKKAYPTGAGWPSTVPIVVVFNQSMNEDSIAPPSNSTASPTLVVRLAGTEQALPGTYDFLLGGTVVVFRPAAPLTPGGGGPSGPAPTSYEVVLSPEARSVDGIRVGGNEQIVAEFTPDASAEDPDGRILTVLPEDNTTDRQRETEVYVVFTKPTVAASVIETDTTLQLRPRGGTPIDGEREFPLAVAGVDDPRIARFTPTSRLDGATTYELVVTSGITFANSGVLRFNGRTPFARFTTLAQSAPTGVTVGNPAAGFPDKINRTNFETVQVAVEVDASAAAGDEVVARIYGIDSSSTNAAQLAFVERSTRLPAAGAQTIGVDFTGALGAITAPRLREGSITFAARIARGNRASGFVRAGTTNTPRLDVTAPTVTRIGPPNGGTVGDLLTDQEFVACHGTASERLAAATFTVGSQSAALFASSNDGRFVTAPVLLGRLTAPVAYEIAVVDLSGNPAPAAFGGVIRQRGVVTGDVTGGTLVVEAYDDATLQPLAGVVVLVDTGLPQSPPSGRDSGVTGADGRATFTNLASATHSITLVGTGYHLRTLLDTPASFVSLPLRPQTGATATFAGTALLTPAAGVTAVVGNSVFDDPRVQTVQTPTATPTLIPNAAIRPNRLQVVTGFGGTFEPTAAPAFTAFSVAMLGANSLTPTPPVPPALGGATANVSLTLIPATEATRGVLAASYVQDFALAGGLDTANLVARPTVRVVAGMRGLPGMATFGVGIAAPSAGAAFSIQANYSLAATAGLTPFSPLLWVSTEARDTAGNLSRHRRLVLDNVLGTTFPTVDAPGIPTISAPGGPFAGPPQVTFQDRLAPTALLAGGVGLLELTATDAAGREWSLLREDRTGAVGAVTLQWPDLGSAPATGLAGGTWSIRGEAYLLFSVNFLPGSFVLDEFRHQQVAYARSAPVAFTVP